LNPGRHKIHLLQKQLELEKEDKKMNWDMWKIWLVQRPYGKGCWYIFGIESV
jgi:hypothetical protein